MIKHSFANELSSILLFENTEDFSQLKSKLKKLSKSLPKSNPIRWGRSSKSHENENKILGDGFELFSELLVLHMGFHPHIGLTNYEPIDADDDEGVDAYATNIEGQRSAVQCKFVSNPTYEFTANGSNLGNFLIESNFSNIDFKNKKIKRLFLITTANGLHYHTISKWRDSVHVINNEVIKAITDNNIIFWQSCYNILRGINNG